MSSDVVPRWGLASAIAGPLVVVGGWTYAARDIPGFSGLRRTISALGEPDAPHRRAFAVSLASLGLCYATTAVALRPVALPGRVVLGVGGLLTTAVAAFPMPPEGDPAGPQHFGLAASAFVALAVWPLLGVRREPAVLTLPVAAAAAGVMAVQLGTFGALIGKPEKFEGLVERVLAATQAAWPLVTVLGLARARR